MSTLRDERVVGKATASKDRPERPQKPPKADSKPRVGFSFDPLPRSLLDMIEEHRKLPRPGPELPPGERRRIMNDRLRPIDATVMRDLLRYRRMTCSCWRAKDDAARRLGVSARTVQQSWRRLALHGFIEQVPVATPDPDDPGNNTGWRIVFLFADGATRQGTGPDRRPPSARKVWSRSDDGRHLVSSPLMPLFDPPVASALKQPVASESRAPVSSNKCAGASDCPDGEELEKTTPSSSSLETTTDDDIFPLEGGGEKTGEADPWIPAIAFIISLLFGDKAVDRFEREAGRIGKRISGRWEEYQAALFAAWGRTKNPRAKPIPDPLSWAVAVANDYAENGIKFEAEEAQARYYGRSSGVAEPEPAGPAASLPAPTEPSLEEKIAFLEGEIANSRAILDDPNQLPWFHGMARGTLAEAPSKLAALRAQLPTFSEGG